MSAGDVLARMAKRLAMCLAKKDAKKEIPQIAPAEKISMKNAGSDKFNVGFSTRDITPDNLLSHTYWMAGYGIAKKITGILDPMTASAMWIDCNDGQGIVLVSCDSIGMTGYDVAEIRDSMKDFCKETGCKNITISCTHTHAGIDTMGYWGVLPKTGKDKRYMIFLKNTIKALCKEAYDNRKSGDIYYGNVEAPDLSSRWREPYFTKALLNRFRFVPDDGSKETWYLNFPAHPNTLGGKNKLLSADYPCYMRRAIWDKKDVNILYSIASIGATDIGKVSKDNVERTTLGGKMLGERALGITDEKKLKPEINLVAQKFVMPIDNYMLALFNSLKVYSGFRCRAESETGSGLISEITYISIGGVQILTMPGEMFPELVYSGGYCDSETSSTGEGPEVNPTPLSEIFEDENIIIFGVTNDMSGYAMAPNDFVLHDTRPFVSRGNDRFGRSHYHETNSCGIKTGKVISDTCSIIKNTLVGGE